jgi:Fe-S-cluster containining protein
VVVKKTFWNANVFLTTTYAEIPLSENYTGKRYKLKSAVDINLCLLDYRHLVVRVDQLLGRVQRKYGRHIACRKGCSCGCRNISIFPVEALSLADALQTLPEAGIAKFQRRAASASFWDCPLLEDRACSLYAFRPLICRTHGFPLHTIYKGQSSVGYCRHNFKEVAAIPGDAVIDLDSINDTLRSVNAATVDELVHILKLPDRLSIAEAILFDHMFETPSNAETAKKAGKLGSLESVRPEVMPTN